MRRGLWWMLGGTAALSAVALWLPAKPVVVAPARNASSGKVAVSVAPTSPALALAAAAKLPLPLHLNPVQLEAAKRDFFALEEPKPVAAAKPAAPVATTPPPPAVAPPAMPYKVVGVMLDPEGRRLVVLAKPDKSIVVVPGMSLDEGFVVESVGDESVQLLYPALDTRFNLPIPRSPQS